MLDTRYKAGDFSGVWTNLRLRSGGRERVLPAGPLTIFTPQNIAAMAAKERGVSGADCYELLEERECGHRSVALIMKESKG